MALTISNLRHTGMSGMRSKLCDIAFDSSYPTGGEALTPASLGLERIEHISIEPNGGYFFEYDYDNAKLKAFTPTATQTAVTTDEVTIAASGAGAITDGQSCLVAATFRSAVDASAGGEVGNTTDLSGVTSVKVMAIGY